MRHLEAVRLAIQDINQNKILLPQTTIQLSIRESQGKPGMATIATKSLVEDSNVDVILVGSEDVFAAHAAAPNMVFVGHTTTAPRLTDSSVYPNVVRTSISNDLVALNIVALIRSSALRASHVKIISGSDAYSSDLTNSFLQHVFADSGRSYVRVHDTVRFAAGSNDLLSSVKILFQDDLEIQEKSQDVAKQYLVLVFAQALDTINLMKAAHSIGISGTRVTWVLPDSVLGASDTFQASMGEDLTTIMKGSFVVHANNGRGSETYTSLWNEWKNEKTTAGIPEKVGDTQTRSSSSSTYGVHGTGPTCTVGTDSDGNDLYMFDDDNNNATRKSCGGVNFLVDAEATKTLTFYIPFVYDAVYLIAHAMHALIEANDRDTFTSIEIINSMKKISFQGASGNVMLSTNGDRRTNSNNEPFSCVLSNFNVDTKSMEPVGTIHMEQNNSKAVEFTLSQGASLVYSTLDGKRPTFYQFTAGGGEKTNPFVIAILFAIPIFSIGIGIVSQWHRWPGTVLTKRNIQMHRLTRVLLQNESFHIVAKDVSSGSTFNCHRSTWVAETHLVDVALLVLRDNQNIEKTTEEVTSLVDEVHFMRKLQQHPNILHCYGLLFMGSSSTDPMQMNLRTNNIDNIIDNKIDTTTTTTTAAATPFTPTPPTTAPALNVLRHMRVLVVSQ